MGTVSGISFDDADGLRAWSSWIGGGKGCWCGIWRVMGCSGNPRPRSADVGRSRLGGFCK